MDSSGARRWCQDVDHKQGRIFMRPGNGFQSRETPLRTIRVSSYVTAGVLVVALSGQVAAQQGAVAGRVTNATTLASVPLARISIVGGGVPVEVISESDGSFELRLDAGVYDLLVEAGDFAPTRFDRVRVWAGQTTTRNLPLESQGYRLAGFIVTASRGTVDTEITAPSSSHSVSHFEITERPATSLVEHLRESPGVDIGTQGIQASNVVVRGFNNIFSGALHMLTDHRLAGLPSLRANFMHFLPLNDEDIERVEVVLGPGSALYGPNTANGVVHLITKSPLESQGTTVSLGVGERSASQGAFRSAFLMNEDVGVKLSGQFLRGEEWPYVDPTELGARQDAAADFPACVSDRQLRGLTTEEAELGCSRVGKRDHRVRRYGLEARADWRFSDRGALVGTYGVTDVSGIELTGLGAAQTQSWIYQFFQSRLTYDRWAVQAYFNFTDSGNAFLLRDGLSLIDRSTLGVLQVQNGLSLGDGRQDFTYGWDYFSTRPVSRGTIYGDYEDDNDIKEWGIYLQSKTALSPRIDLIAAGRIDSHSILPDHIFSPRVALIVKPDDNNAIRFAYNRAFSTPTVLNHFLDLGAGFAADPLGSLGYSTRAFGSGRNGFAWQDADGSLRGMRSPFNPAGPGQLLPADQPTLWQLGLGVADQQSPFPQDVLEVLQSLAPGTSDVDIMYLDVNNQSQGLLPLSTLMLADVPAIRETNTETLEAGWSGVFENTVRVSLDVYYRKQNAFVSPLVVETPLLYLDRSGIEGWMGSAYVPARVQDLVNRLGLTVAAATTQATAEAAVLVPSLAAGISEVPLAVASSDVPQMENGGADLIATYRNLGDLSLWGGDVTLQWFLSPEWTLRATYSHVSENWFRIGGSAPLALNAPANKGTLGIAYRDEARGLSASARVRYTGSFPFQSTNFVGTKCVPDAPATTLQEDCIAAYAIADLTLGYKVPSTAATVQLGVNNVMNTGYRSFLGVPTVGRLAMARIKYDFF
jgi:iron complex outermembrane receptor protein